MSSNYVLGLIFVVNIKFTQASYHTIVPSTEELLTIFQVVRLLRYHYDGVAIFISLKIKMYTVIHSIRMPRF